MNMYPKIFAHSLLLQIGIEDMKLHVELTFLPIFRS